MRLSLHPGVSQFTLLSLALVFPVPLAVTSYPHSPTPFLPTMDTPELESALLQLQSALEELKDDGHVYPEAWAVWPEDQDPQPALMEPREAEEALLRAQRGDPMVWPLLPFPGDYLHYQEGGEGRDGGKRNEALSSIAGGLQAVSREKGGFGFRFGRKRWTDGGMKGGGAQRSGTEDGGGKEELIWR
ncbi:uncharacterized protein LOC122969188 [Scomber scombrus]|uniref:Uncharacterized protein LOC122969188 n=1 Tax=Scomber scombrus TaxID=13677 RepID=A0AAV1Q8T1_SCOSC